MNHSDSVGEGRRFENAAWNPLSFGCRIAKNRSSEISSRKQFCRTRPDRRRNASSVRENAGSLLKNGFLRGESFAEYVVQLFKSSIALTDAI